MPIFGVSALWSETTGKYLKELSLSSVKAVEIGFNSRVPSALPENVVDLAKNLDIRLSLHLPFFISWVDGSKTVQSARYLSEGAALANTLGTVAVFHLGYYGDRKFEDLRAAIVEGIRSAIDSIKSSQPKRCLFGIETSGKIAEIGSLQEILAIAKEFSDTDVIPIVDWSHLCARSNGQFPRNEQDFRLVIDKLESELKLENFYFHASGIEFKNHQEKRHLSVKTCIPPLPHLLKVLNEIGCEYTLIVESPDPIPDVLWLEEVRKAPEAWLDFAEERLRKLGLQQTLA